MKVLQTALPPRHHDRLSGTLDDQRRFVIEFDDNYRAVVEDEIADLVVPLSGGTIQIVAEADAGAKSDAQFIDGRTDLRRRRQAQMDTPFPEKMDILSMPELRPSYLDQSKLPEPKLVEGLENELVPAKGTRQNRRR